jgi:hypothetical protein
MPRKNIYFKDKIDREIENIIEIERQKGANGADISYSSQVNELVKLGLMVHKSREETSAFDLEGYRRDLISKVSGTREGMMIIATLITEMYLTMKGPEEMNKIETYLSQTIGAINTAESEAEKLHFVQDEA